ncbi:trigger factor [Clostridiales bacterium COT073_COT-073]|nr:trigger factor [Clostridiales bacterium COT073_COT-073]
MSAKIEKLEKSMVKITMEVDADTFKKAVETAYQKNRGKIQIPGFRKGKAPRKLIEKAYGSDVFYEDAANEVMQPAYEKAIEESGLDIVSRPLVNVVQAEEGKEFIFTAEVAVKPEVSLTEYKGLEIKKEEISVSDEEIEKKLEEVREKNARIIDVDDRPVKDGDTVTIDYAGSVDGVAFDGGTDTNHKLTIGSGQFIPGFEDQVIGHSIGEEFDVNVTFPSPYHSEELAGKEAVFAVKLHAISEKELPDLDDELAQDVSDFDTLAEYKEDLKKQLLHDKEHKAEHELEHQVMDALVNKLEVELPEPMVDLEVENQMYNMEKRMRAQGFSLEQYMQFTGQTVSALQASLRDGAVKSIKGRLALEAVAKAENLEVSEEDINKEYQKMADMYQMDLEKVKGMVPDADMMKEDILNQKALALVKEAVKFI